MTTIACNKFQIAADRQATHTGGLKFRLKSKLFSFDCPLIYPVPFHVGLCGNIDEFSIVYEFFSDPMSVKKAPKLKAGTGLILTDDGKIWTFCSANNWIAVDQPFYAVGSGMNFAMGAMAAGASPYEAIKQTCKHDPNSGMGVTKIDL